MRNRSLGNKGFGLVGTLATVVLLIAVGSAGVYMYHHNHKNDATAKKSSENSASAKTVAQTFFTCLASKGTVSTQGPTTCTLRGKSYAFPSAFTTADIVDYNKTPTGVRALVVATAQKNFDGCVQTATTGQPYNAYPLVTVDIATHNFVAIGVDNCDSGHSEDFGLQGTTWSSLGGRQTSLSCDNVTTYGITQSMAINDSSAYTSCMDASGNTQPIPQ